MTIQTEDGLTVTVTDQHGMKLFDPLSNQWIATPAKNMMTGNTTMTKTGVTQIIDVKAFPARGQIVYNLELDLPKDIEMHKRTVVSDGICTLDLYAQGNIK